MTAGVPAREVASVMHVRCPDRLPEDRFREVLELLAELCPVVRALPPSAALVEVKGALRYHGVGPRRLAEVIRLRTVARLGVDVRIGIGPTITVAATASRQISSPGGILAVDHGQAATWLAPLPVEALHGIGPRQATVLRGYGVDSVGVLASLPPATVQRMLGGRAGRLAADRARGIDPRPVTPRTLPTSTTVSHTFARDTLDGAEVRGALLDLVVQLGALLRQREQAARALHLALRFAGGPSWEKSRRLPEASAHEDDLRTMVYRLIDAAGLQRGRLTGLTLRGEDLVDADQIAQQISLDGAREDRLIAETVSDRIRAKFGPGAIVPAATLLRVS
ncbi:hypothetical protein ACFVGN_22530 [Streptomyces sp. NPDC057757]|uniref:DNA polymerase Y family protein n=1 Tax=Streptomyces sp. NPDC057757 TaxID=3346241 RepID=UPI00369EB13A